MIEKSAILAILRQYFYSYEEIYRTKIDYFIYNLKLKNKFENSEKMRTVLKNEVEKYLDNVYYEMAVLDFILKNERNLFITDIYNILVMFNENYGNRLDFLEDIFENLQTALDMELDYKFYIPRNRPKYITEDDYQKYLTYVKGFNNERVKEFLLCEEIYEEEILNEVLKEAKIMDVDVSQNLDLFGVFENKLVLANTNDEISSLLNIHELVHKALLLKENEIEDESIIFGEDLPVFYELLFKRFNIFVKENIHTTDLALQLLKDYNFENFNEQIIKLKRLKEIKNRH